MPATRREYFPFIDWMKAAGIVLIVNGHVSDVPWLPTAPVFEKQLGVAFFVFVTGFSLVRETRPSWRVVYNRLFEMYLFGLSLAVLLSGVGYLADHNLRESNYLPFMLGANVLLDDFPANPTTWFVGTYVHLLLVWALVLRGVRIAPWMIAVSLAIEVGTRAVLAGTGHVFTAYMLLPNWATVFLLGMREGQRSQDAPSHRHLYGLAGLLSLVALWPVVTGRVTMTGGFPFLGVQAGSHTQSMLLLSLMVSTLYAAYAWSLFRVATRLPSFGVVRFLARNTPIVFLAHMPVHYALLEPLAPLKPHHVLLIAVRFVFWLVLLAALSEGIRRAIDPLALRERLLAVMTALGRPAVAFLKAPWTARQTMSATGQKGAR